MQELASAVGRLRTSTARLNSLTDKVADLVREVEDFLNVECSVGITASVKIEEDGDENGSWWEYLEYDRCGDRFRIIVRSGHDYDGPAEDSEKPWVECSRETKLKAAEKLPQLLIAIADAVDEKIETAQAAKESIENLIGTGEDRGDS